jgi:hypothetical protein
MVSRRGGLRSRFALETLERRVALSGIGGLDDGADDRRGHAAEVQTLRRGADDPAGHHADDDRGGLRAPRRGRGADGPAGHR